MLLIINVLLRWLFSCLYNILSQLLQNDNFNVSALQEEGIYQVGKGYLYSLLLLVVCDWWIWGLSVLVGHVWG